MINNSFDALPGFVLITLLNLNIAIAAPSTTDSTNLPLPLNTPMTLSAITATIIITVQNSGLFCGCCNNVFPFVAQCPAGSIPNSINDTISGIDVQNCLNSPSLCKPSITVNGRSTYSTCGSTNPPTTPKNFASAQSITTTIQCNLSLQGWFPATNIATMLNGQLAAPVNNFNLGTYTVTYPCNLVYNCPVCTTSVTPPPSSPITPPSSIPSYIPLCPNSSTIASFSP